jgi:hypothetical protein
MTTNDDDDNDPLNMDKPRIDFVQNPFDDDKMLVAVTLPEDEMDALEREAIRRGVPLEQFIHDVIKARLDEIEPPDEDGGK